MFLNNTSVLPFPKDVFLRLSTTLPTAIVKLISDEIRLFYRLLKCAFHSPSYPISINGMYITIHIYFSLTLEKIA